MSWIGLASDLTLNDVVGPTPAAHEDALRKAAQARAQVAQVAASTAQAPRPQPVAPATGSVRQTPVPPASHSRPSPTSMRPQSSRRHHKTVFVVGGALLVVGGWTVSAQLSGQSSEATSVQSALSKTDAALAGSAHSGATKAATPSSPLQPHLSTVAPHAPIHKGGEHGPGHAKTLVPHREPSAFLSPPPHPNPATTPSESPAPSSTHHDAAAPSESPTDGDPGISLDQFRTLSGRT